MASIFDELDNQFYSAKDRIPSGSPREFADSVAPMLQPVADRLGVDPYLLAAQFGLETGWGKSVIRGTNNLGNIKDFSGSGVAATDNMTGSRDKYRAYDSPQAFADDYATLIEKRYPNAVGAGDDPVKFASALKAGGYAEDPAYVSKIEAAYKAVRNGEAKPSKSVFDDLDDQYYKQQTPKAPVSIKRSAGEAISDVTKSVAQGVGQTIEGIGTLYGLASGDMNNGLRDLGKTTGDYWENARSEGLKEREVQRKQRIDSVETNAGKFGTAIWETVKDPALLSTIIGQNIPMLVPGAVIGRAGRAVGAAAGLGERGVNLATVGSAITGNAVMQGSDVAGDAYDSAMALPQELWEKNSAYLTLSEQVGPAKAKESMARDMALKAGVYGALISAGVNSIPGMQSVEKLLTGTLRASGQGAVKGALGGTLKEAGTEAIEEGGGKAVGNLALQAVDPTRPLDKDVAEAAGLGAAGGGPFGAVAGGIQGRVAPAALQREPTLAPTVPQREPVTTAEGVARVQAAPTVEAAAEEAERAIFAPLEGDVGKTVAEGLSIPRIAGLLPAPNEALPVTAQGQAITPEQAATVQNQQLTERLDIDRDGLGLTPDVQRAQVARAESAQAETAIQIAFQQAQERAAARQTAETSQQVEAPAPVAAPVSAESTQSPVISHPPVNISHPVQETRTAAKNEQPTSDVVPQKASGGVGDFVGTGAKANIPAGKQLKAPDISTSETIPQKSPEADGIRPHLETLVKRRAVAKQLGYERTFNAAVEKAKAAMKGETINPRVFETYAKAFAKDEQSANAMRGIAAGIKTKASSVDAAANQAATSAENKLPEPTEAQRDAGNFPMGHTNVGGLDISVEHPAGTKRRPEWPTLDSHYGYVKGVAARAPDKEHVDVFVKPGTAEDYSGSVFVVDQNHEDGTYDEPKIMVGHATEAEAREAYLKNYTKGWKSRVRGITPLTMDEFKAKLNDANGFSKPQVAETPAPVEAKPEPAKLDKPATEVDKAQDLLAGISKAIADGMAEGIKAATNQFTEPVKSSPEVSVSEEKQTKLSRTEERTPGLAIRDAQAVFDRVAKRYKNLPPVTILNSPDELPNRVKGLREDIQKAQAWEDVEAAYYDGEIFAFADNVKDEARFEHVLFTHELTHYGLRGVLGTTLDASLNGLMARSPELRRKATELRKKLNLDSNVSAMEEALADMPTSELLQLKGIDKLLSTLRNWLNNHGFTKLAERLDTILTNRIGEEKAADALLSDIVKAARDFARNGKPSSQIYMGGTRFAGVFPSQTNSPEFKKWFGDSVVVDDDDKPLRVYHGTHANFDTFVEGNNLENFGGLFFTNDPSVASRYAGVDENFPAAEVGSIMPVYLKLENPLVIDFKGSKDGRADALLNARANGHDGAILRNSFDAGGVQDQYVVFNPEQVKSAIGNRGTFDANNADVRFSRASWDAPEPTKLDNVIYSLQDKHIDTRRVVQAIKKNATNLADSVDVYLQEELFHGRTAKLVESFLSKELNPLMNQMSMRGIKSKDDIKAFEKYLHARHAQERNEQIAKVNPAMPDGGSGMTTKDAKDYISSLDPAKQKGYEALAKAVDAINVKTRQSLVDYGLESQETIDAWNNAYKHYVPLQREDMEGGPGLGQGFTVKGSASKRATGSKKTVVDILANIAMQREKAIVRGEKNKVANALVGLATANPNADFWEVDNPPKIKYIDPRTGLVNEAVDPMYKSRDNVVTSRTPDSTGAIVEHAVIFDEGDERAVRMAKALKNLDADQLGEVLGTVAKMTRYFAAINTQYNPIFGVVNIVRDTQGAMLNLSTTPIADKKAEVWKNTLSALRGIYIDLRDTRAGNQSTSAWAQLFEEFQNEGGQTGYRDMFRTSKDRGEAIEREITKVSEGKLKQFGRGVFDWLSDYNSALENAVRLSAYKVAKDAGISNQQAASIAKNLTVNFNRKGQVALQTGALYAFFNASAQGTARLAETLRGPAGKKIISGGIMLGVVQALALAAAGFDDEEPPDFVRERNFIIPIGDKKYLTIPMPLGLHFLPNLGRIPAEFVLSGFKNPAKRIGSLFNVFADTFNPIGNAGLSLQTIAPTVIDPLAALAENRDWTGKPIAKQSNPLAPTPGHRRAKDTASAFSKAVSEGLNWVSGGTDFKPGFFSPTPDQLDYLIGQVTGGLGREAMKVEQTVGSGFTGEELPPHKVPLVGRFYGDSEAGSSQAAPYYENIKRLNEHEAEIKGRRKSGQPVNEYLSDNPEAMLFQLGNSVERKVGELQKRKRTLLENDAPREQVKAIEEQIKQQMKTLNERIRRVQDRIAA